MNKKLNLASLSTVVQETIRALEKFPDVTRVSAHEGQILAYPGHSLPGVFLVLTGVVIVEPAESARNGRPLRKDAAQGPFLLPAVEELDGTVRGCIRFEHPAEMLFIPRSLVHENEELRRLLIAARLSAVAVA